MAITSANQLELLQTAEAVAREKMIDPALVVEAMEESLARAAKSRYGAEMDIRVSIDRKTGKATFTRVRTVIDPDEEELENYQAQLTPEQAKQYLDDPKPGDVIVDEVPPVEMNRIAAQSAKQVILQKVREAERDKQYEDLLQDHLFGRLRRDTTHFNGWHFFREHIANLGIIHILLGLLDGEFGLVILQLFLFDHSAHACESRPAGFAVDGYANVHFAAVTRLGGTRQAFFHRLDHQRGVDHLLARNGLGGLQQFQLVG